MQDVFQIAKVKKDSAKTFLPFFMASEVIMFSIASSNGMNAAKSNKEVYGIGGQASQAVKAVASPKR